MAFFSETRFFSSLYSLLFTLTLLSPLSGNVVSAVVFLAVSAIGSSLEELQMKKKAVVLAAENELLVDLTFHNFPASLLAEFAEKIVGAYYRGNLNAAVQDLIRKALAEQEFVLSRITHVRDFMEAQQDC